MARRVPAPLTSGSGIGRFVATLASDLPTPPAAQKSHALPAHCIRLKLRTIRQECGVRRLHESHFIELAARLKEAGVHTRPALLPGIGIDEWVRFSRLPFSDATIVFSREEALKTLLATGIGSFGPLKNLRLRGEEYRLSTGRRVDFLCEVARGADRGTLVVVELKRAADQRTAEQVIRYLTDLRDEPVAKGRNVRAIVITGSDDSTGVHLVRKSGDFQVEWFRYDVSLDPLT